MEDSLVWGTCNFNSCYRFFSIQNILESTGRYFLELIYRYNTLDFE